MGKYNIKAVYLDCTIYEWNNRVIVSDVLNYIETYISWNDIDYVLINGVKFNKIPTIDDVSNEFGYTVY